MSKKDKIKRLQKKIAMHQDKIAYSFLKIQKYNRLIDRYKRK